MKNQLTENELRNQITQLESLLNSGGGTVDDANRLADMQRQLDRIVDVKHGLRW